MTVTFNEYMKEYVEFAKRHNRECDCREYTGSLGNNRFHKDVCWEDGSQWCELRELIAESVETEVHGIKVNAVVELWRTEFWSTEAPSKYFYERA